MRSKSRWNAERPAEGFSTSVSPSLVVQTKLCQSIGISQALYDFFREWRGKVDGTRSHMDGHKICLGFHTLGSTRRRRAPPCKPYAWRKRKLNARSSICWFEYGFHST